MADQYLTEHTCKSCGHIFRGLYCNVCGEKIIEPVDRKFRTFLTNVLIATTFVDNKFLKCLWLIIKNPGFLSREYVNGRRVKYMRPLQIFFILNLIYFLFPVLQMFNSTLQTQLHVLAHSKLAQAIVIEKLTYGNMSLQGLEMIYNNKTTELAKLLVVIFIILASFPLSIIFVKKKRYFTDHVALSVELTSFNLAINAILLTIVFEIINKLLHFASVKASFLNDTTLTVIFVSTNLYFIFRAAKTFYGQKGKRLVFKAMAGILGLFWHWRHINSSYSLLLFGQYSWSPFKNRCRCKHRPRIGDMRVYSSMHRV